MKYIFIFFSIFNFSHFALAQERPNVIVVLVDDMGFSDIGSYGSEIQTTNLDKMAANGVRFTQFYNTSRCCPTRASLLTGLDHHQAGMGLMIEDRTEKPGYKGYLVKERCTTMAQVLKNAGYGTYMTGKWHLGNNPGEQPLDWGFDRFYGSLEGAISYFEPGDVKKYPHDKTPRPVSLDRTVIQPDKDFYATNRFTDYAQLFLTQHLNERKKDPFFLYLAYNAPHWPLHALPQDIKKYEDKYLKGWDKIREERYQKMVAQGVLEAHNTQLTPRTDGRYKGGKWPVSRKAVPAWDSLTVTQQKDLAKKMAVYAAMMDNVDQNIGRLVEFLKEKGQLENTMILFLSDNGGDIIGNIMGFNDLGERGKLDLYGTANSFMSYGLGWANTSNTPFRMYKTYVHEGGISTPLIVHWPKGLDKKLNGKFIRTPSHLIDLMPTFLEVAKTQYPKQVNGHTMIPLEGQSLIPLLSGQPKKFNTNRQLYWEHAGCKAVRDQQWKLVQVHEGPWELYDLEKDRCETNNLIEKYPERAEKMKQLYKVWADRAFVNPALYE
ncbi:MAG: arylsulfatase [Rufibacter sp.]